MEQVLHRQLLEHLSLVLVAVVAVMKPPLRVQEVRAEEELLCKMVVVEREQ